MLRVEWVREGKPAALIATGERGKGQKLEEEIGDILYELDPQITVYRALPDTIVVYSFLDPIVLFRRLLHWPPAYAARITPLLAHIPCADPGWVLLLLFSRIFSRCLEGKTIAVEARVRGSSTLSKHLQNIVSLALRSQGIRVARRGARLAILVECIPGVVCGFSLMPLECTRVSSWWDNPRTTALCSAFTC